MRARALFWFSAGLIVLFIAMAIVPQLFTNSDPTYCDLSLAPPPTQRRGMVRVRPPGL